VSQEITPVTVAARLRERIEAGALGPGDRLPTQQDLSAEFGVNRTVVRHALGALREEGLVSMGRGAPATVTDHSSQPAPPAPRAAGVLLPDRIRAAFRAEHVTIDTFSLTTETLQNALSGVYQAVRAGELSPRSVTLRVLVPSDEARLALPRPVTDPADERPLQRLHAIMRTCHDTLLMGLDSLRVRGTGPETSVEFRSVRVTPLHKLYVLNGTEALIGYYQVVPRKVSIEGDDVEIYDVLGLDSTLFHSSCGPDARDAQEAAFVRASRSWFESLWSTIARPFPTDQMPWAT
jgi:DNA-binding transcriptional regulator YhcF (GntR family)